MLPHAHQNGTTGGSINNNIKSNNITTVPPEAAATATSTTAPGANKDNRAKLMQSVVMQSDLKMYQTQALGS